MLIKTLSNQFYVIRSLLRHPDVSRDEIVAFQNKQLRRLISHAYENVPYYRRLFDQDRIKPKDIQTVADLSIIPITTKKDLQSLPSEELVARGINPRQLISYRTSGSSGEPFIVRRTWLEDRVFALFRLRAMHYFGQRPTDKVASVGLIHPIHPHNIQFPMRILQTLGLYHYKRIDSLMSPTDIVRKLRHFRPNILTGHAGIILEVALAMNDKDHLEISPRFVRVNGQVATPMMKRQITEAFSVPVFDYYACREFGAVGWECKETGELHTCDDSMIVEVLKNGRPVTQGERGEVMGTNLHSFAMPFIRYRLGDTVTKGSETCKCGQSFSTIKSIQGRMIDYFPLPGRRMIHPYELVLIIYQEASWIRKYQLIQEKEDRINLHAVPFTSPTTQQIDRLKRLVYTKVGQDVEFCIKLVPEINLEPDGKFRLARSYVKSTYDWID